MRRRIIALAAALLLLGLATPANAAYTEAPFAMTVTGTVTYDEDLACTLGLSTDSDAVGTARHLGRITMTSSHCTPGPQDTDISGLMTLTSAQGDTVDMVYAFVTMVPTFHEDGSGYVTVTSTYEITGGTGRFAAATGTGTGTAVVSFTEWMAPVWTGTWTYAGTISR